MQGSTFRVGQKMTKDFGVTKDAGYPRSYTRSWRSPVLRAILTDSHFWLPLLVLMLGLALLLHLV